MKWGNYLVIALLGLNNNWNIAPKPVKHSVRGSYWCDLCWIDTLFLFSQFRCFLDPPGISPSNPLHLGIWDSRPVVPNWWKIECRYIPEGYAGNCLIFGVLNHTPNRRVGVIRDERLWQQEDEQSKVEKEENGFWTNFRIHCSGVLAICLKKNGVGRCELLLVGHQKICDFWSPGRGFRSNLPLVQTTQSVLF